MTNPDFVALAKAMGVHAIRCDSVDELPAKMKEFMEYDNQKPVLFEARVVKVRSLSPPPSPSQQVRPDLLADAHVLFARSRSTSSP